MSDKKIKDAVALASTKGLKVVRCMFRHGISSNSWCITLPNGSTYVAIDGSDMISYVRGY